MTAHEKAIFAQFSGLCADRGLLHADETALLPSAWTPRAPSANLKRLKRVKKQPNAAVYDWISVEECPHWTGRRDNQGLPIVMIETAHLDQKAIAHWRQTRELSGQSSSPDMAQRALVHFDYLTRFVFPLCSALRDRPLPSEPVTKAVYLVDGSSICLRQAWNLRDFAQDISWILATCYPETIDRIFLCNAPSYFSKIWSLLKKFVDPVTAEKIVVLDSTDVYGTLNKYIHHDDIPTQFGGAFQFSHGMLPDLCPVTRQTLRWAPPFSGTLPPGPIKWTQNSRGPIKAVATGTVDGVVRGLEVAVLDIEEEE